MAQIVPREPGWGTIIGEGLGHGTAATLDRLIQEKARKIEEKHSYERNLKFLQGVPHLKNEAAQLAHGSDEQVMQLLKQSTTKNTSNPEFEKIWNETSGNAQPGQEQEVQELEQVLQGNPTPEGYANPKVQQALMKYLSTPEAQQQYTPEQLQKAQQKLQRYAQQGSQQPSRTQQLMQPSAGQQDGYDLEKEKANYERLMGSTNDKTQLAKAKERYELRTDGATDSKEYQNIVKHNAAPLKILDEYIDNAVNGRDLAIKAYKEWKKVNPETGEPEVASQTILPDKIQTWMANGPTGTYMSYISELVGSKAARLRGPVGKAKLEFSERTKAGVDKPRETQGELLRNEIEEGGKALMYKQAKKLLLDKNNDREPRNFADKIEKQVDEWSKVNKKVGDSFVDYEPNTIVTGDDGKDYIATETGWERV